MMVGPLVFTGRLVALELVPEAKAGDTLLVHAGVALSLVRDEGEAQDARED